MIVIGHRGAKGHEPENTLKSFEKAIELGADMVELDVHITKDDHLVVIHDSKVDRTTNGKGLVSEKTLSELRELDAGKGERIPTLAEVIELVDQRVPINIELKSVGTAERVSGAIKFYIAEGWRYSNFLVSSFDHNELAEFIRLVPEVESSAIIAGVPFGFAEYALGFGAQSISLAIEAADDRLIGDAKDKGMKVYIWNLGEQEDFALMAQNIGADGCITDFPDRAKGPLTEGRL